MNSGPILTFFGMLGFALLCMAAGVCMYILAVQNSSLSPLCRIDTGTMEYYDSQIRP